MFTLSSISSDQLFWSVNHASINESSELAVFSIANNWGAMVTNCQNYLSGTNVNKTFDAYW